MNRPVVNIHIESITFTGLGQTEARRAAEAFRLELGRLFQSQQPPNLSTAREGLQLSSPIQPRSRPEQVGAQAARSFYEGLNQ